jgi:hypothetical protein
MPVTERWTDEQRAAVAIAVVERGLSASTAAALAAAGDLKGADGNRLEPFPMPATSVRTYVARYRRKRAGGIDSPLAELPHRDAVEQVRRRFANVIAAELEHLERQKAGTRDLERLRQLKRAAREWAALPDRTEPRPVKPGARADGKRQGAETKPGTDTIAGRILADVKRQEGEPPQTRPAETDAVGEASPTSHEHRSNGEQTQETTRGGSLASALDEARAALELPPRSNGS